MSEPRCCARRAGYRTPFADARKFAEAALKQDPDDALALGVLSDAGRAREYGTKEPRLLFHAGAIRLAQGETAEGQALVKQALALNPVFDVSGGAEARKLMGSQPAPHGAVSDARKP